MSEGSNKDNLMAKPTCYDLICLYFDDFRLIKRTRIVHFLVYEVINTSI